MPFSFYLPASLSRIWTLAWTLSPATPAPILRLSRSNQFLPCLLQRWDRAPPAQPVRRGEPNQAHSAFRPTIKARHTTVKGREKGSSPGRTVSWNGGGGGHVFFWQVMGDPAMLLIYSLLVVCSSSDLCIVQLGINGNLYMIEFVYEGVIENVFLNSHRAAMSVF